MFKNLNKKGFTIVELVIVIAVIAILSAVLIPTFSNVIENARSTANLQEAKNELDSYVAFMAAKGQTLNDGVVFVVEDNNGDELAFYAYYKGGLHEFKYDPTDGKTGSGVSFIDVTKYNDKDNYPDYMVTINGEKVPCTNQVSYFTNSSLADDNGHLLNESTDVTTDYYAVIFAYKEVDVVDQGEGADYLKFKDNAKKLDVQNDDGSLNVKIYAGRLITIAG